MKVTDELIIKGADAMVMINNQASWVDLSRAALEAALANVPEPNNAHEAVVQSVREEVPEHFLREADGYLFRAVAQMAARIRELEAQLQKARDWWENAEIDPELGPLGVILGCLDEEKP